MTNRTLAVFSLSLAVLGASWAVAGEAPVDRGSGVVSIERLSDGGFALTLSAPADRKAVLDQLCLAADASCTFPEATPATRVGPLHVRGSWSQVADALLKDSGLSFATGGLTGGTSAQLVLVVSVDRATTRAADDASSYAASGLRIEDGPLGRQEPVEEEPSVAEVEEAAPAPVPAGPMIVGASGPDAPTGPLVATPFFAPDGRPIFSVTRPQPTGLNTEPTITPFADSNGQSIVAPPADGPPTLTPFSGPDGEPIPAPPPAQPGVPQGNPFPPADRQE